jgi:cytochrome P450
MFPRIANEDMRIAGEEIARGTRVVLSPYVSHRLEGNFRNSEAFDPTRWIEKDFTLERGSFFPFGMGTRICIGERFAKLTATLFLYELIKSGYTIELDSNELSFKSHSFLLNIDTRIKFWMSK